MELLNIIHDLTKQGFTVTFTTGPLNTLALQLSKGYPPNLWHSETYFTAHVLNEAESDVATLVRKVFAEQTHRANRAFAALDLHKRPCQP